MNFKNSSSHINNNNNNNINNNASQIANNAISNKFINSYKNNHVVTTRNISVPLPLPSQDVDSKVPDNQSKDRMMILQGKISLTFKNWLGTLVPW